MSVHTERNAHDSDIYRGGHPTEDAVSLASSASASSSSSSSSSSSLGAAGRLGAIAAKLELAISRWAKNVRGTQNASISSASSSTSSSSSSSSSLSSVVTLTRSQVARRRRRTNARTHTVSSLRSMRSERDIAARIERMKALERSRLILREFKLYLPPRMIPSAELPHGNQRIIESPSLPTVLAQLDLAMRTRNGRPGRHRRGRQQRANQRQPTIHEEGDESSAPPAGGARRNRKGKRRADEDTPAARSAWFLDVANPTWADLRAIGKVLHIHPLTLEDILQQDPREKLEIFAKLGYYFISFRSVESRVTAAKVKTLQREAAIAAGFPEEKEKDGDGENDGLSGVGEANVYLAVFKDGICCFHFTDVSEHTDRVRNRISMLEKVATMSADWIAHDILDSIVDSFFPFLEEIEKEITAIDHIVYSTDPNAGAETGLQTQVKVDHDLDPPPRRPSIFPMKRSPSPSPQRSPTSKTSGRYRPKAPYLNEKATPAEKLRDAYRHPHPQFIAPHMTPALLLRRGRRGVSTLFGYVYRRYWPWRAHTSSSHEKKPNTTQMNLRRMARTRKLVTVLGRLLGTKVDVVTQIRKRLEYAAAAMAAANGGAGTSGAAGKASDELEVAIYMGDVEDHILTLQHSLAHYERMLSQSHPTYLAQLRSNLDQSKGNADMNILYLSVVSLSVLCMQVVLGICSMNVTIPANNLDTGPFNVFGIVIALALLVLATFLSVVRYWWNSAKRKRVPIL